MSRNALPAIALAGIIILLFFLVAACAIVAYLYLSAPPQGGTETPGNGGGAGGNGNHSAGNGTIGLNTSALNISGDDMALWDSITINNVEAACLQRAKEEAGGSAGMVYSCDCEESASALEKSYDCAIETADPFTEYFADIDCRLERKACSVTTNYGTVNVSFSELRGYYSD